MNIEGESDFNSTYNLNNKIKLLMLCLELELVCIFN